MTSAAPTRKKRRREAEEDHEEANGSADEEGPACQSCRKRKARCSRQQPCTQCDRLGVSCVYDERRKPGMKPGAIEALGQRLNALENIVIGQGLLLKPLFARMGSADPQINASDVNNGDVASIQDQAESLKAQFLQAVTQSTRPAVEYSQAPEDANGPQSSQQYPATIGDNISLDPNTLLPPEDLLLSLLDWYFENIHRWIPILHVRHFRQSVHSHPRSPGLVNILRAVTSLCLRFHPLGVANVGAMSTQCRDTVILRSMERFSVENLQALIIVAFDIIASGRGPSAWSVVGSIARTVEQLRLSREESSIGESSEFLFRRISFLPSPKTWIEEEERRRVFWTVFVMDRFCSVATGWNNSLTGDDVRRRLPCEGQLWEAGDRVETPFFGIAQRPSQAMQQVVLTPSSETCTNEDQMNALGAFAFFIEATETLNFVTQFFLEYSVSFKDAQSAQLWLLRFKELDLRLVKWRLFLPVKWRNASSLNQDGIMDPNLTLAHVTHNTAVIQLHQSIAFPSADWRDAKVSLPSEASLNTCVSAASEVGSISQRFLEQNTGVTNPQLSFCLFVAGRVLLVHSSYHGVPLHPAFETILAALAETARLWSGSTQDNANTAQEASIASRFYKRLADARRGDASLRPSTLDVRRPVYSEDIERSRNSSPRPQDTSNDMQPSLDQTGVSPFGVSMAFPPLPMAFDMTAESLPTDANGLTNIYDNIFDGLNGLFDDQYDKGMRISTYGDPMASFGGV